MLFSIGNLQSCNNTTAPRELNNEPAILQKRINNDDLKLIAKNLAYLLKEKIFREILEQEIRNANNRENIIDASVFFKKNRKLNIDNINRETTILEEILNIPYGSQSYYLKSIIENLKYGIIDLYFPIVEHRNTWNSKQNLLVAAVDHKEAENPNGKIPSYDLNGNLIILPANKIPDTPVLTVSLSETHGNYPPKIEDNRFDFSTNPDKIEYKDWFLRVKYFRVINTVGDGIFGGAPEYYTYTIHPYPNGTYKRTNFYEITGKGLYYFNRTIAYKPSSINPYNSSSEKTRIAIMEDDGGWTGSDDTVEDWFSEDDENNPFYREFHFSTSLYFWYYGRNNNSDLEIKWEGYIQ